MRPFNHTTGLYRIGVGFAAAGIAARVAANWHMRSLENAYGVICGGPAPHCPLCPTSLALVVVGAACLVLARSASHQASPHRARSSRSI